VYSSKQDAVREQAKKELRKLKWQQHTASSDSASASDWHTTAQQLMTETRPLLNMPSLADPQAILVDATHTQYAMIAQPQVQNLHRRVFGGFLLQRAFELTFSNAYIFADRELHFVEVGLVSFMSPVDVSDLLVLNSRILYTSTENSDVPLQQHVHASTRAAPPLFTCRMWKRGRRNPKKYRCACRINFILTLIVESTLRIPTRIRSVNDEPGCMPWGRHVDRGGRVKQWYG
jgi:hypothetical protein